MQPFFKHRSNASLKAMMKENENKEKPKTFQKRVNIKRENEDE